jgi:hypothetical protein
MRILSYWRLLKGLRYMIVFRLLLINEELIDPCSTQASANIFSVKKIEPFHERFHTGPCWTTRQPPVTQPECCAL